MKTKTVEKSPLFVGQRVRIKKGDGIIVRDGGPGGSFGILMSKDAEKGYANQLIECRMGQFVFLDPDSVRDLCDDLLGEGPELSTQTVEDIVQATREDLGINADDVKDSVKEDPKEAPKAEKEVKQEAKKE